MAIATNYKKPFLKWPPETSVDSMPSPLGKLLKNPTKAIGKTPHKYLLIAGNISLGHGYSGWVFSFVLGQSAKVFGNKPSRGGEGVAEGEGDTCFVD